MNTGGTALSELLGSMDATLEEGTYVFATLPSDAPDVPGLRPRMRFVEEEGITLVLTRAAAELHGIPHAFPCRLITLGVHSALEAVGFLAVITARLSKVSISTNTVSGYYHDHLFVPVDRANDALAELRALSQEHRQLEP